MHAHSSSSLFGPSWLGGERGCLAPLLPHTTRSSSKSTLQRGKLFFTLQSFLTTRRLYDADDFRIIIISSSLYCCCRSCQYAENVRKIRTWYVGCGIPVRTYVKSVFRPSLFLFVCFGAFLIAVDGSGREFFFFVASLASTRFSLCDLLLLFYCDAS